MDVFPTLCDVLGEEIPFGAQGKSLEPLLTGKEFPPDEYACAYAESGFGGLYWEGENELSLVEEGASQPGDAPGSLRMFDCLNTWTQCGQVRMLRKWNLKIQMDMLGNGYLYDLQSNPFERDNLFYDKTREGDKAELLAALTAAMLRACDPLPAPRRRYRYKRYPKGFWFGG